LILILFADVNNEQLFSLLYGYNKLIKHRGSDRGGGVALLINSDLTLEPMDNLNNTGTDEYEFADIAAVIF